MIRTRTREGEPLVKRSSFAKIGAIMLALVMGLGLMGIGVSYWSQTLLITATVETGDWGVQVTKGTCSHPAIISCDVVASDELEVTVTDAAVVGVNYYCEFSIENTGDIPLKIQSIVVVPDPPASGVVVWTTDVVVDTQIEPGVIKGGKVYVSLTEDVSQFTFTVTFNVVPWNQ